MKYKLVFVCAGILAVIVIFPAICFSDGLVTRQEMQSYIEDSPIASRFNSLADLKQEVGMLLDENKKLQDEYNQLLAEKKSLQETVNQYKQQVMESRGRPVSIEESYRDLEDSLSGLTIDGDDLGLNEQKKVTLWKKDSRAMIDEETIQLLKLKLADLQYTKKDLEMQFKLNNYLKSKTQKSLAGYKKELDLIIQKEEMLKAEAMEKEEQVNFLPQKISVLERENEKLREQLERIKIRNNIKEREVALKKDKKTLAIRSKDSKFFDKVKEKERLEVSVNSAQNEYEELQQKLEASMSTQVKKKEIIQNVIDLDRENQALRNKIINLKEKITDYQY